MKLVIASGVTELIVETRDTETGRFIQRLLPVRARAMSWGKAVYFMAPLTVKHEANAKAVVSPGEIAFWVQGHAIVIGYGETPLSAPGEIRLAAPCNIWADAIGDVSTLQLIEDGDEIEVRALIEGAES